MSPWSGALAFPVAAGVPSPARPGPHDGRGDISKVAPRCANTRGRGTGGINSHAVPDYGAQRPNPLIARRPPARDGGVMSHAYACDYCGEPIDADDPMLTISVRGATDRELFVNGWIGHYHGDSRRDCYDRVRDGIDLVQEYAGSIAAIPVATGQAIAAKRRKHRKAREEDS